MRKTMVSVGITILLSSLMVGCGQSPVQKYRKNLHPILTDYNNILQDYKGDSSSYANKKESLKSYMGNLKQLQSRAQSISSRLKKLQVPTSMQPGNKMLVKSVNQFVKSLSELKAAAKKHDLKTVGNAESEYQLSMQTLIQAEGTIYPQNTTN